MTRAFTIAVVVSASALVGCQKRELPVAPVVGKVLFKGAPLDHGRVMFQPTMGPPARGTIRPDGTVPSDGILSFFIAQQLPTGLRGLIIAAIFAEATSSLVTSMHSTATVWSSDFYRRWFPQASDRSVLLLARTVVALLGTFSIVTALWMSTAEISSMWDFFLRTTGPLIGSSCGLFLLGIFTARANAAGALIGAISSAVLTIAISLLTPIHFLLCAPIGIVSCVTIGYVASHLFAPPTNIRALTYQSIQSLSRLSTDLSVQDSSQGQPS